MRGWNKSERATDQEAQERTHKSEPKREISVYDSVDHGTGLIHLPSFSSLA